MVKKAIFRASRYQIHQQLLLEQVWKVDKMLDYVYYDRKMMKWMPLNALLEQGDYINDLLHGSERKTILVLSIVRF